MWLHVPHCKTLNLGTCGSMWFLVSGSLGCLGKSMCWTEDGCLRWNGSQLRRPNAWNHVKSIEISHYSLTVWEHVCIDWYCWYCSWEHASLLSMWSDVTLLALGYFGIMCSVSECRRVFLDTVLSDLRCQVFEQDCARVVTNSPHVGSMRFWSNGVLVTLCRFQRTSIFRILQLGLVSTIWFSFQACRKLNLATETVTAISRLLEVGKTSAERIQVFSGNLFWIQASEVTNEPNAYRNVSKFDCEWFILIHVSYVSCIFIMFPKTFPNSMCKTSSDSLCSDIALAPPELKMGS